MNLLPVPVVNVNEQIVVESGLAAPTYCGLRVSSGC